MPSQELERGGILGLTAFLGFTSVLGGSGILLGWIPLPEESLEGSPFDTYLVPGLVLLVIVGGSGLSAFTAAFFRHPLMAPASVVAGLMIMAYEFVEVAVIGYHWLQAVYFFAGMATVMLGALPLTRLRELLVEFDAPIHPDRTRSSQMIIKLTERATAGPSLSRWIEGLPGNSSWWTE
jgi:hypothetical protein